VRWPRQVDEELPGLAAAVGAAPRTAVVGDALGYLPTAEGEPRTSWRPVEWMELHEQYLKEVDAHAQQVRAGLRCTRRRCAPGCPAPRAARGPARRNCSGPSQRAERRLALRLLRPAAWRRVGQGLNLPCPAQGLQLLYGVSITEAFRGALMGMWCRVGYG